jgi:hypothetical protein
VSPYTAIRALHTRAGIDWRIAWRKANPSVRVFGDVAPIDLPAFLLDIVEGWTPNGPLPRSSG